MRDIYERRARRQISRIFRSHVENCLKSIWEKHELITDDDEDYPYRSGAMPMWVSVTEGVVPGVRVFAHVLIEVQRSAKLLNELNDVNASASGARSFWHDNAIIVCADLPYQLVDEVSLRYLIDQVSELSDGLGEMISIVHGGRMPLADVELAESESDEDVA
jgi:hypothetical protein